MMNNVSRHLLKMIVVGFAIVLAACSGGDNGSGSPPLVPTAGPGPAPTPTPAVTATPSVDPTPVNAEATPTPTVAPTAEPTLAPTTEPTGTPDPSSTPDPSGTPVPTENPTAAPTPTTTPTPVVEAEFPIRLNQIGFHQNANKVALVADVEATTFDIVSNSDASVVYSGSLSEAATWAPSSESIKKADFSDFTTPGEYRIQVAGALDSHVFGIGDNALYNALHDATIKAYYFNRASAELLETHAGIHARPAGHPDNNVLIHASAADATRPAGTVISVPKGWYDAGDYNKYIVNSGISVYTLLLAYQHYPQSYQRDINIPESDNGIPDILDEVLWNLEWMLAMQDPNDGGVYHKVTTLNFSGEQMPHTATAQRYVVRKSTAAALNFAAVMAAASRVYVDFSDQLPGLAEQMRSAAESAWNWALANPDVEYNQGSGDLSDVNTGEYGDSNFSDEFAWAAAELFVLTEDNQFLTAFNNESININIPGWQSVQGLAFATLADAGESLMTPGDYPAITDALISLADNVASQYQNSPIDVPMENNDFFWGSNSQALNKAFMTLQAYRISPQRDYLNVAYAILDYILGRNATEYSFVTGFGTVSPQDIHHRVSVSDGVAAPVPGFVAGGPHGGQEDGCQYPSNLNAKSYLDDWCSYATNEVTINWNAPLVYLLGALQALAE